MKPENVLIIDWGFTIVDIEQGQYSALTKAFKREALPIPGLKLVAPLFRQSSNMRRVIDRVGYAMGRSLSARQLDSLIANHQAALSASDWQKFRPYEKITEVLALLADQGYLIVLASTMSEEVVKKAALEFRIKHSLIVGDSGSEPVKPDTACFSRIAKGLTLADTLHPSNCIVVGNSPNDMKFAKGDFRNVGFSTLARMKALYATWGNISIDSQCKSLADAVVPNVEGLIEKINGLQ